MAGLCDSFQRGISYLRISVTDRCNLRCVYCMPPEGVPLVSHKDIMSFEEILLVVKASVEMGIDKIRITGGEPLVRLGIVDFVRMVSSVKGVKDISMTTNGILLERYARDLAKAGLHRINISLDTLKPDRFRHITRTGNLADTLKGIETAKKAGLDPVKINMVPIQNLNEDEIVDFARMTEEPGWHVRFIELMPLNGTTKYVPSHVLQDEIGKLGKLNPVKGVVGNGAARYFQLPGAKGTIGFISPMSEPFCNDCNRLRLSATGMLYPCLFSNHGIDLKPQLRSRAGMEAVQYLIKEAIAAKPQSHCFADSVKENTRMSKIGG